MNWHGSPCIFEGTNSPSVLMNPRPCGVISTLPLEDTRFEIGGILSPIWYSIFINIITQNILCAFHLYAHNLQRYYHADVDKITEAITKINGNLPAW